jgi:hypothetical protein
MQRQEGMLGRREHTRADGVKTADARYSGGV